MRLLALCMAVLGMCLISTFAPAQQPSPFAPEPPAEPEAPAEPGFEPGPPAAPAAAAQPAAAPRSDEELADAIRDAYAADPYAKEAQVDVSVQDAVATLSGTVESIFLRDLAVDLATGVPGVDRVASRIDVPVVIPKFRDRAIQEQIQWELGWNPWVDADGVAVRVADGVVTLTGAVDSKRARRIAAETAADQNVRCVIDRIRVHGRAPIHREAPPPREPCPR